MKEIKVKCYSGYKYPEKPEVIVDKDKEYKITKILRQWNTPYKNFFEVEICKGIKKTISYSFNQDKWFMD